jgi:hypothetical protein
MTMYLPNDVVRPTGYEAGEFIDPGVDRPAPAPNLQRNEVGTDDDDETRVR